MTIIVSIPFELLLYRRIYRKSDPLIQVLMTIGITFFIIGVVNFIFGPSLKSIPLPNVCSAARSISASVPCLPTHRVFVIACGLVTALALWLLIEKTEFGIKLRASVDHSGMADALGIRTEIIYAVTFAHWPSGSAHSVAWSARKSCRSSRSMRCVIW